MSYFAKPESTSPLKLPQATATGERGAAHLNKENSQAFQSKAETFQCEAGTERAIDSTPSKTAKADLRQLIASPTALSSLIFFF